MTSDASAASSAAPPELGGVEHDFIELPQLRMHVAEAGSGEPVLLLHGFPQHWWEWRTIIPELARDYRIIAPDQRGAGWTDAPARGYDRRQLLADIVALLDARGLERVHVIGHDWGALIAYQLCLLHPERVRSYLCLGPHPFVNFDLRMMPGMWRLWFQFVIATPGLGPRLLGRGRQRLARYLFFAHTSDRRTWLDTDVEMFVAQFREPARAKAASALYRGFIIREVGYIMTGWYKKLKLVTPTRVLYGREEASIPAELLGGFERYAEDMTLEIVDGAAHYLADEKPQVVVARARELFAEH